MFRDNAPWWNFTESAVGQHYLQQQVTLLSAPSTCYLYVSPSSAIGETGAFVNAIGHDQTAQMDIILSLILDLYLALFSRQNENRTEGFPYLYIT